MAWDRSVKAINNDSQGVQLFHGEENFNKFTDLNKLYFKKKKIVYTYIINVNC